MNDRGFTLMELLVTIGLISVMAAIAYPSIRNLMGGYQIRGAARQIYSDMQMARLGAIKEGRDWAMVFSADGPFTSYNIRNGAGATFKTVAIAELYSGMTYEENFNPAGTVVATFTGKGTSSSGNVKITRGSRNLYIRLNGSSGNIRITNTLTE